MCRLYNKPYIIATNKTTSACYFIELSLTSTRERQPLMKSVMTLSQANKYSPYKVIKGSVSGTSAPQSYLSQGAVLASKALMTLASTNQNVHGL